MSRLKVISLTLLGMISIALLLPAPAAADPPYTTWALGPQGRLYRTQDAYIPLAEVDLPVSNPEDLFITPDGALYVADTGNGRVIKLQGEELVAEYGKGVLGNPTGLFVTDDGTLYVADAGHNAIFIFDAAGTLLHQFGRPTEPLFGKRADFLPRKVAVDARRNLYIISEGAVNGVVQLNLTGNFIGYFGANTATMSLKMILQRMFLTEEQLAQFIKNEAASPSNLDLDQRSLLYTVTAGTAPTRSIRKFTIAGKNIFPDTPGSMTFRDIDVSADGLVAAVDANGQIYEYVENGTLLFMFGAPDQGEQRLGTLRSPSAIQRYQDSLYVLDKDKNALVIFGITDFARKVHQGVRLYVEGFYTEAEPYFNEVLTYNGSFLMAYQALADAYFKQGDYRRALTAYHYAEDREGYSQAFWELRNAILQQCLSPFLLAIVALSIGRSVGVRLERRYRWFDPVRAWWERVRRQKWVDDALFMFRFIKQPADSFYYIKKDLRGSLGFAIAIYVWVIVSRLLGLYLTSFVFSPYANPSEIHAETEILLPVLLIGLWNAANYLVATIQDGEGRVRDVVIGTAYSLFPLALFTLPIALLSNVLSLNEIFVYNFSMSLVWAWTGLMLVIMVMEIHNYSFKETLKSLLVTLFTMAMFVLTAYIFYVLFTQLYDFVVSIIQEIGLRVAR